MKQGRFFNGIFVLLFCLLCFAATGCTRHEKLERVTIAQFGQQRFLLYLPLYVAMEKGLFAKRGLDIHLLFAGNDNQVFAAVVGGSAQFGVGDPVFTAISHDKGGPGKVIAMMITRLGLSGVTRNPAQKEITRPEELEGLRISSFARPSTTYTLLSEIKREHDLKKMEIVEGPFGGQIALLEAGRVDIAMDIEPSISIAEDRGYRVVLSLEKFTPAQAITGVTALEETLAKRPDLAQKVVGALDEALVLLHTHPEVAVEVAEKILPTLKPAVVRAAVARELSAQVYPAHAVVPDDLWQRTLRTRLESGELKQPQATGVAVDNRFAVRAQAEARATP